MRPRCRDVATWRRFCWRRARRSTCGINPARRRSTTRCGCGRWRSRTCCLKQARLPNSRALDVAAVLRDAVLRGQVNVVAMLVDRMGPLGSTTLLHDAALKGQVEIIELLLAHRGRRQLAERAGGNAASRRGTGGPARRGRSPAEARGRRERAGHRIRGDSSSSGCILGTARRAGASSGACGRSGYKG